MKDLIKIRDVSQQLGLSTRTLRYYEQIGLIESIRSPDYAYRLYDEQALQRLKQIMVLRKMQISLKDIQRVLLDDDATTTLAVFVNKLEELDMEITALGDLRHIITAFVRHLETQQTSSTTLDLLYEQLIDKVEETALSTTTKEKITMENLDRTDKQLSQLKDVRIVRLPPMRIASYKAHSTTPEKDAWEIMTPFYQNNLKSLPSVRSFGFNNPCPDGKNPEYGYEIWYSVPNDVTIKAPLEEKAFPGGLYAVYVCTLANIGEIWQALYQWVEKSDQYEPDFSGMYTTHPGLEETLDMESETGLETTQLDIFIPIKPKE